MKRACAKIIVINGYRMKHLIFSAVAFIYRKKGIYFAYHFYTYPKSIRIDSFIWPSSVHAKHKKKEEKSTHMKLDVVTNQRTQRLMTLHAYIKYLIVFILLTTLTFHLLCLLITVAAVDGSK